MYSFPSSRSVCFSPNPITEVHCSADGDEANTWYSSEDIIKFKCVMAGDATECSKVFEIKGRVGLLTKDIFINCLGLESLLISTTLNAHVERMKIMHLDVIFIGQACQKCLVTGDADTLALLLERSSVGSRGQSLLIARHVELVHDS